MADDPKTLVKLEQLRSRIHAFLVFRGVVTVAGALLAVVLGNMALDWMLRPEVSQRVVLNLALLAWLGWIAVRHLLVPASVELSDEDVAVLIEHRSPELGDRLISSLQFDRMIAAGKPVSPVLAGEVKKQAAELTADLKVGRLIDGAKVALLVRYALVIGVVTLAASQLIPAEAWALWARRNLQFDGTAEWPTRCRVTVEGFTDYTARIPHGEAFPLRVRAEQARADGSPYEIPDTVEIHFRFGGGKWQSVEVHKVVETRKSGDGQTVEEHVYKYPLGALFRPVELEVTGGDYRTPRHTIEIASRPELVDAELTIEPPAYTRPKDAPASVKHKAAGTIPVLLGSQVALRATSSKPLQRVELWRGDRRVHRQELDGAQELSVPIDATDAKTAGNCKVLIVDAEGVTNRAAALFSLSVEPDQLPQIRARPTGIGDRVTRWARIPLEVEVRDRYGLGEVGLRWELHRKPRKGDAGKRVVKGYLVQARHDRPGEKRFQPTAPVAFDLEADFEKLRAQDNSIKPPAEGDRLRLWIEATDYGGESGAARRTVFPPQGFHFQLVPDTVLSKHLLAKQKRIRRQYSALLERQKTIQWIMLRLRSEAEGSIADAARVRQLFTRCDNAPEDGKISPDELAKGGGGDAARHKALDKNGDGALTLADWGAEWTLDADAGKLLDRQQAEERRLFRAALRLASGLTRIREEMENNRLDRDGQSRAKLEQKVIKPMKQLADRQMNQLATGIELLAQQVGGQPVAALDRNIDLAQEVLLEMAEILRQMVWSELFDDVVTRLRTIFQLEQELRRLTEEEHRRRIESLLPDDLREDEGGGEDGGSAEKDGEEEGDE